MNASLGNSSADYLAVTHNMSGPSSAHLLNGTVDLDHSRLQDSALEQARQWLRLVMFPLIVCLAFFGNSMVVVIVYRLRERRTSMDQYLTVIAVMDTLVLLITQTEQWLAMVAGFSLSATHHVVCKLVSWLAAISGVSSAWLLVAMTTQRALSVAWPHRVNVLCTPRTTWVVNASIVLTTALTYVHVLYGMGVMQMGPDSVCNIVREDYFRFVRDVWTYVELLLKPFLPFACILAANVVLLATLYQSLKHSATRLGTAESQQATRSRETQSVTLTVVVVSLSYIVLMAPAAINNVYLQWTLLHGGTFAFTSERQQLYVFLEAVLNVLVGLNYCLNFYLYCLTGPRFRREFNKILCGCRRSEAGVRNRLQQQTAVKGTE